MTLQEILRPKKHREIPFLILISFLATFLVSRLIVELIPELNLKVRGTHVHHYAYGIIILVLLCYGLLVSPRSEKTRLKLSLVYGVALGLAFDEFAMWIQLEDAYYDRSSYDAIVTITLILLNIVYFGDFWKKWGYRLKSLIVKIFS